jgi:hypothetical protein
MMNGFFMELGSTAGPAATNAFPHSLHTKSRPIGTSMVCRVSAKEQFPKLEHLPDLPCVVAIKNPPIV